MSPSAVRWLGGLLVSVTAVAAVTGIVWLLEPHVPVRSLLVLYVLTILPVAVGWGTVLAAFTSILSAVCFAFFFLPPIHTWRLAGSGDLVALGVFLVTAVVVGELAARIAAGGTELGTPCGGAVGVAAGGHPGRSGGAAIGDRRRGHAGGRPSLRRRSGPHGTLRR